MSTRLPAHVQYRNATYYGIFEHYQRNGHGLLVLDNSQILLAQWRKNAVHGKYIFISDTLRAYGQMLGGRLDGYNILWTKNEGRGDKTLYGMFREDKLYGKAVTVENGQVMVAQFTNSELKEVISKSAVRDRQVYEALTQHFPKSMYTLEQFLINFMREAASAVQGEEEVPRYMPVVVSIGEDRFFGYEQCFNKGRKYGFMLQENRVLSVGEHSGTNLQGIGRFYAQDCIEDGIFKEGHLRGIGIKYYPIGNKYVLGEHDGKSSLEKGFGFPTREICEIRKEFHLRSIYFYNDIVMLGLTAHFTSLLNSLLMEGRPVKRSESPKFNQQNRQTIPALYKYQMDPDIIDDSSPIKDKLSEYKPVDRKANKYFTLDQGEEEYDRKRQKQKSLNKMSEYREVKDPRNFRERENSGANSRFNERSQNQVNSRGRMGVGVEGKEGRTNIEGKEGRNNIEGRQGRQRSGTRTGNRSGVKDTREFVRQLEEEQKKKRLDLDKIYRQAGLYRKR